MLSPVLPLLVLGAPLVKPPSPDYKLVWSDEFNGKELDPAKWGHWLLGKRRDAINVKDTVWLDGKGILHMVTKRVGSEYHTAMISTEGKYETTYGYIECRMKLQTQRGHWSAFWLQSPTIFNVGDTKVNGVEVDVVEYLTKTPDLARINMHWDGYGKDHKTVGATAKVPNLSQGFHTFALNWNPYGWIYYIDDREVWRTTQAPSRRSQFLILSLEVGPWAETIADSNLPDGIEVDWVRVWRRPQPGEKERGSDPSVRLSDDRRKPSPPR